MLRTVYFNGNLAERISDSRGAREDLASRLQRRCFRSSPNSLEEIGATPVIHHCLEREGEDRSGPDFLAGVPPSLPQARCARSPL